MLAKTAAIRSLSPARYQHVVAAAADLGCCRDEELFYALGVDMYAAGLRALAPTSARRRT